jgi:hypothetical protein
MMMITRAKATAFERALPHPHPHPHLDVHYYGK